MTPEEAVDRQQQVVDAPPNLFVRACPGAGKTRTVVDRFVRVADDAAPKAVAAISFTNRASDELSGRCATTGHTALARHPHYVGTLDRFIAIYIVRPFADLGGPIRIVESWDALDVEITAYGVHGKVSLDHFEASPDGILHFQPRPGDPTALGQALQRLEKVAKIRYDQLRREGYLTCDDARACALRLLDAHPEITELIRERFAEIIVDEAQDCSVDELALLNNLRQAGVPIVVVCDPHQAIYEWRDADAATLESFTADLNSIELTGNWRSAPDICALAATIRGGPADEPVGPYRNDDRPIVVIRFSGWPSAVIGSRFVELVSDSGLDSSKAVILAHASSTAAAVAGAGLGRGNTNVATLASACIRLFDPHTEPRERQRAFDRVQRLLLRMVRVNGAGHTTERIAELASIDMEWLRRTSVAVVQAIGSLDLDLLVSEWLPLARAAAADAAATAGRPTASAGTVLPTPKKSADKSVRDLLKAQVGVVGVRYSTVHAANGTEEEAVLMVLPRDRAPSTRTHDLIGAWSAGQATEAKRVLYVVVTRAERLCALAVPESEADHVLAILQTNGVSHEVHSV